MWPIWICVGSDPMSHRLTGQGCFRGHLLHSPRGIPLCFAFGSGVLKDALGDAAATSREQSVGFKVLKLNLTNNRSRGESTLPSSPHSPTSLLHPTVYLSGTLMFPFDPLFWVSGAELSPSKEAHRKKASFEQRQGMQLGRRA